MLSYSSVTDDRRIFYCTSLCNVHCYLTSSFGPPYLLFTWQIHQIICNFSHIKRCFCWVNRSALLKSESFCESQNAWLWNTAAKASLPQATYNLRVRQFDWKCLMHLIYVTLATVWKVSQQQTVFMLKSHPCYLTCLCASADTSGIKEQRQFAGCQALTLAKWQHCLQWGLAVFTVRWSVAMRPCPCRICTTASCSPGEGRWCSSFWI